MSLLALALPAARPADAAPLRRRPALRRRPMLLLQERVPRAPCRSSRTPTERVDMRSAPAERPRRRCACSPTPNTPAPEVHLLSNGRYHVMVTNAGGGYSRWRDLAVTRWREDATRDDWGSFCYLRDVDSGDVLVDRATSRRCKPAERYEAIFSRGPRRVPPPRRRHRHAHRDRASRPRTTSSCAASRSPTAAARARTIELTSYAEVVLAPPAADARTRRSATCSCRPSWCRDRQAILCTRRPRSADEQPPWMFHLMAVHGADVGDDVVRDRPRAFIGRGRTRRTLRGAWTRRAPLSDSDGLGARSRSSAIRRAITLAARRDGARSTSSPASPRRATACLALIEKYQRPPPRRSRVRAGLDAQPGRAAPAQRQRGRCAAVRPPGRLDHLRARRAARRRRAS